MKNKKGKNIVSRGLLFLSFAIVTTFLGSCGIYSKYQPAKDVPEDLFGNTLSEASGSDSLGIGGVNWRELFTDVKLQKLIELALNQNSDLRIADLRIKEAEATLLSSRLAYLPSFALSPQGSVSSFDGAKALQTYSLPVTASWELDLFGSLRNAKEQSKALVERSRDYSQAVRSQIVASVANTYYTLLMLDEQLAISKETEKSWKETLEATKAMVEAGLTNEVAVQQMQASLIGVQTSVLDLEEQINQVENAMSLLLAATPHHIERGTLDSQTFACDVTVGVPLSMLTARPDVRMAERELQQAFYATAGARSSFYPSVTLSGSAGWSNSSGMGIVNPGKFLAQAVGSLTQPLFAKGQLTGRLKIAKAQQEEAEIQFVQTLLNAGSEVNDAMTAYQNACNKKDSYVQQVSLLEKAYINTSLLMEYGNTTYLDVLTAQQALLGARLTQTANRFAEIQAVISLYHALGGGV
ncbi:MAG: TolC family protein [Prevotella sp.]